MYMSTFSLSLFLQFLDVFAYQCLGRNGLQEFQRIATQQGWLILAYETFDRTSDPSDIDVTLQLNNILDTGKEKWA